MNPDITFTYEGVTYTVDAEAYQSGRILLPDKRLLIVDSWIETYPPKPDKVHEPDVVELANLLEAHIAVEEEQE